MEHLHNPEKKKPTEKSHDLKEASSRKNKTTNAKSRRKHLSKVTLNAKPCRDKNELIVF